MPLDKQLFFREPPFVYGLWQHHFAWSLLAELTYWPDLQWDNRFASAFGFTSSQTVVTPGRLLPNYVKLISNEGCVFSVAGTTDPLQMVDNIIYSGYETNAQFGPGSTHSYFTWVARSLAPMMVADLASVPPDCPVSFTGHSLGGAVAQLLAKWFEGNTIHPVKMCNVFCSPMVGNDVWTDHPHTFKYTHLYNGRDWVPHVPPGIDFFVPILDPFHWLDTRIGYKFKTPAYEVVPNRFDDIGLAGLIPFAGEVIELPFRAANSLASTRVQGSIQNHQWLANHKCRGVISIANSYAFRQAFSADWGPLLDLDADLRNNPLPDNLDITTPEGTGTVAPQNFMPPTLPPAAYPALLPFTHPEPPPVMRTAAFMQEFSTGDPITVFGRQDPPPLPDVGYRPELFTSERKNWAFKGEDRRLLSLLYSLLLAIEARDEIVYGGNPSAAISVREPIFDALDYDTLQAVNLIRSRVEYALSTERG